MKRSPHDGRQARGESRRADRAAGLPLPARSAPPSPAEPSPAGAAALPDTPLTESRLHLARIVQSAMDAIISIAEDGRIVLFNSAAEAMFGTSAGTMLGRPIDGLIPERFRRSHEAHVHGFLAGGRSIRRMGQLQPLFGRRSNGEEFPVEASISKTEVEGKVIATVILRDISQRVASEGALAASEVRLRDSEARLRLAQQVAGIGIFEWEPASGKLHWSAELEALHGLPAGSFPGRREAWEALVHPDDRPEARRRVAQSLETGLPMEGEWRVVWPDGSVHWLAARWQLIPAAAGKPLHVTGANIDITARKNEELARRESEARFRELADAAPAMLWLSDGDGSDAFISRGWHDFTGQRAEESAGKGWLEAVHPDDRDALRASLRSAHAMRAALECEFRVRRADGAWRWVLDTGRPRFGADGGFVGHVGAIIDITERKEAEAHVRLAALHDPLTGLPNRAMIFEYGRHLVAAAERSGARVGVLFLDLDRFKPINDTYGHEAGDRVLQEIARRLLAGTRKADLVGRLGGDEFVVLLCHRDSVEPREAVVAEHLLAKLSEPIAYGALTLGVTPSIGISHHPEHGLDIDQLLHAADLAMYQAKQAGRANYHFYTSALDERAGVERRLEARLKRALDSSGLTLHYQPVIDIDSGRLVAAEALVRLGAEGELVLPRAFVPIAESAGLIDRLGCWVAMEACRQQAAWHRTGLAPLTVAINVSPLQFRRAGFAERLGDIVAASGIDPARLQLEVTESSVMERIDDVAEILARLKAVGITVALDDVGTGHSSLKLIGQLPLDKLKIDQAFVQGIERDPASLAITRAIVALGHTLGLDIVAEGVETPAILASLREVGCNQAQGFLISRPMPAAAFSLWRAQQPL